MAKWSRSHVLGPLVFIIVLYIGFMVYRIRTVQDTVYEAVQKELANHSKQIQFEEQFIGVTSSESSANYTQEKQPGKQTLRNGSLADSPQKPLEEEFMSNESLIAHSRWKLYGGKLIYYDGIPERLQHVKETEKIKKVNSSANFSANAYVNQLIDGLHNLQVSCYDSQYGARLYDNYSKFLEVLATYTEFHIKERHNKTTRRLVWVCDGYHACGGLADRIKGITSALMIAIITKRVLLIGWRDSSFGDQTFLETNIINWQLTEEEKNIVYSDVENKKIRNVYGARGHHPHDDPISVRVIDAIRQGDVTKFKNFQSDWVWITLVTNLNPSQLKTDTASLQWIKQGVETLGIINLPDSDISGLVGLVFRYLFKFSEEIRPEVDAACYVLGLTGEAYIGVHVRTGFAGSSQNDNGNNPKLYHAPHLWNQTLTCAHSYATKELGNNSLLFLATDSNLVKNMTLDVHTYQGRMRTLNNSVVHVDKLQKTPHKENDMEKEGFLSVWVELLLLAESYGVVIGDSGFAFVAHRLCFIPDQRVIHGIKCNI